jgi:hypothetical protein
MNDEKDKLPWWRYPMVWLVISGPVLVVVASFVTLALAWRGADLPLQDTAAGSTSDAPALQARNHVATHR